MQVVRSSTTRPQNQYLWLSTRLRRERWNSWTFSLTMAIRRISIKLSSLLGTLAILVSWAMKGGSGWRKSTMSGRSHPSTVSKSKILSLIPKPLSKWSKLMSKKDSFLSGTVLLMAPPSRVLMMLMSKLSESVKNMECGSMSMLLI